MSALVLLSLACIVSSGTGHASALRARALEAEIEIARRSPDVYYVVVDLPKQVIQLKAGGKELMSGEILSYGGRSWPDRVSRVTFRERVPPHLPVPSQGHDRLAGRRLPLNFVGRLIEGPTQRDRLMFAPALVVTSGPVPRPPDTPWVTVSGPDLKSLSSALDTTVTAIVIPLSDDHP